MKSKSKVNGGKKKNPLIGKQVWTLTITNDQGSGSETFTAVFTSFAKAMNAARTEFRETGNMDSWDRAKKELKEQYFFYDPMLFNGDRFLIDCLKIY